MLALLEMGIRTELSFILLDNEYYFNGYAPYGDMYADIEKFAFFSKDCIKLHFH